MQNYDQNSIVCDVQQGTENSHGRKITYGQALPKLQLVLYVDSSFPLLASNLGQAKGVGHRSENWSERERNSL
jgi:hypothetical protein